MFSLWWELKVYSLNYFSIYHTAVLTKVIMLYVNYISSTYMIFNWKFVPFNHLLSSNFSLSPIPCSLASGSHKLNRQYNLSPHIPFPSFNKLPQIIKNSLSRSSATWTWSRPERTFWSHETSCSFSKLSTLWLMTFLYFSSYLCNGPWSPSIFQQTIPLTQMMVE